MCAGAKTGEARAGKGGEPSDSEGRERGAERANKELRVRCDT